MNLHWRPRPDLKGSIWESAYQGLPLVVQRKTPHVFEDATGSFATAGFIGYVDGVARAEAFSPWMAMEQVKEFLVSAERPLPHQAN